MSTSLTMGFCLLEHPPVNIKILRSAAQKGAHVLNLNKGQLFAGKPVHNNVSRSAAPKLALVPTSRYNFDEK